jgi:nitrite reductase [NAD(P)H] small subunit
MEATLMRSRTVKLGSVEAIPLGEGRAFVVDGEAVAVFRTRGGGLFATQASCPHGRGPLADGLVGRMTVLCPLHAFAFDLASGRSVGGVCADLRSYAVSSGANGEILLQIPALRERTEAESLRQGTAA